MSYNINLQHIVFRTKHSERTIPEQCKAELLGYMAKVSDDMGVPIIRANAYLDHLHILINFPVTMSLPEYIRKLKATSSKTFCAHPHFPTFNGWAIGYGSFSVSRYDREKIIKYICGQTDHHRYKSFQEELEELFGKDFIKSDPYWKKNWVE